MHNPELYTSQEVETPEITAWLLLCQINLAYQQLGQLPQWAVEHAIADYRETLKDKRSWQESVN